MASIRRREVAQPKQAENDGKPRRKQYRYALLYRDRAGKQRSETFAVYAHALARKSDVEREVRDGSFISPRDSRIRFGEWYERWSAGRNVSPSRAAADASLAAKHVLPRWEKLPIDAITHMEVQAWVGELSRSGKAGPKPKKGEMAKPPTGLSPATVSTCLKLLRVPLDAAVRDGKLRSNPTAGVQLPNVARRLQTHETVLTGAELSALVAEVPERWRALIFTMGWLGLRWSEALGLTRKDFNPLRSQLHVARQVVVEVNGKNEVRTQGKTDSAARLLQLPAAVAQVLNDHVARFDTPPDGYLFAGEDGQPPLRTNFNRRVFAPAVEAAGLSGRGITLRQLRHTGASLMLDAGLQIQDVSQRMGHARPSTTHDIYAHLLEARQTAGTAAMDAAIKASLGR